MPFIDITRYEDLVVAAREFAATIKPGDIIGLRGELGAGKTTFVKLVAKTLGVRDEVISPTFVYHQTYTLPKSVRGIERLHHLDLYRLSRDTELDALGIEIDDELAVYFIEWINHAPELEKRVSRSLVLAQTADGRRHLEESL